MRDKASLYPSLKLEPARGILPTLFLRRVDGEDESISVAGWTSDQIEQFMKEKLVKPSAQ